MRRIGMLVVLVAATLVPAVSALAATQPPAALGAGTALPADFNGDGYSDLAIGIQNEDVGMVVDAGAVAVIYGSSSGLSATAKPDQLWTQDSPGMPDTAEAYDYFGAALATGNFNGDAYMDLAIGVPEEDIGLEDNAGAVHVIYGSGLGLNTSFFPDQYWEQDTANVEGVRDPYDNFGFPLAAGDFNGDDRDDLAIGVAGEDLGDVDNAGAVNVIYGGPNGGLSATFVPDQFFDQNIPGVEGTAELGDSFGAALAVGDFGGGFDDLAIGVPHEDTDVDDAGAVEVIYGSNAGLDPNGPNQDQLWTQDSTNVEDAEEEDDQFGSALVAGNFDDTYGEDLAIGVQYEDLDSVRGNLLNAGAVEVLYGTSAVLTATTIPDQFWTQDSPNVAGQAQAGDRFGYSLAAANFGGDQRDDLAVGVPFEEILGETWAGAVNVIYGAANGLSATATADQFWTQNTPDVNGTPGHAELFGYSLTAATFNTGANADLAIAVPFEAVGGQPNAGGVELLYGSAAGLSATNKPDQFWTQDKPDIEDAAEPDDRFGSPLAAIG